VGSVGRQLDTDIFRRPTQTQHTSIPASGPRSLAAERCSNGSLPSWTAITPENPGLDRDYNLTNVAGTGTYATSFTIPLRLLDQNRRRVPTTSARRRKTIDIPIKGTKVGGVHDNDRNQVDIGRYLHVGSNELRITVATPPRNAVAVAPATPAHRAGGQLSSETLGTPQGCEDRQRWLELPSNAGAV
jgi:hypothetical protein